MSDLISRQAAMDAVEKYACNTQRTYEAIKNLPPVQQEDGWLERNKDRILRAGLEGREIEFRIGGRLFAIREKAQ